MNAPRSIFDADMTVRPARRPAPMPLAPRREVQAPRIAIPAPVSTGITIRGVTYADVSTAAAAVGVTPNTVLRAITSGRLDRVGLGSTANLDAMIPVTIAGVEYPSRTAAARALGVSISSVIRAVHSGRMDRLGEPRGKRIFVDGQKFHGMRAAAKHIGGVASSMSAAKLRAIRQGEKSAPYMGHTITWED